MQKYYFFLVTKYTPSKITAVPKNWINLNCSPSNSPQKIATKGIKYVVDTEKTGDEIANSLMYKTFAIAVQKTANINK